ncbi:hypothetical protein HK098_006681 [Nowakowskiella sp. JEL0407]|nr:hypothetical protein HK098_006681 [Nowakowskiella sp. JEL0407]
MQNYSNPPSTFPHEQTTTELSRQTSVPLAAQQTTTVTFRSYPDTHSQPHFYPQSAQFNNANTSAQMPLPTPSHYPHTESSPHMFVPSQSHSIPQPSTHIASGDVLRKMHEVADNISQIAHERDSYYDSLSQCQNVLRRHSEVIGQLQSILHQVLPLLPSDFKEGVSKDMEIISQQLSSCNFMHTHPNHPYPYPPTTSSVPNSMISEQQKQPQQQPTTQQGSNNTFSLPRISALSSPSNPIRSNNNNGSNSYQPTTGLYGNEKGGDDDRPRKRQNQTG